MPIFIFNYTQFYEIFLPLNLAYNLEKIKDSNHFLKRIYQIRSAARNNVTKNV
tara:strand:- start:1566 stop:1724 length:159 start_codon:yes stop_codon:yes gene_type:complete